MAPAGKMQAAIPTTKIEIGNVAKDLLGASMWPTMDPVAYTTTAFAPASACAAVRRKTLLRCIGTGSTEGSSGFCVGSVTDIGNLYNVLIFERRVYRLDLVNASKTVGRSLLSVTPPSLSRPTLIMQPILVEHGGTLFVELTYRT